MLPRILPVRASGRRGIHRRSRKTPLVRAWEGARIKKGIAKYVPRRLTASSLGAGRSGPRATGAPRQALYPESRSSRKGEWRMRKQNLKKLTIARETLRRL